MADREVPLLSHSDENGADGPPRHHDDPTPRLSASDAAAAKQYGVRWLIALAIHIGLFAVYAQRICISMAGADNAQNGMQLDYGWSKAQQSNVLASFFYGYLCAQFAGGFGSDIIGAKNMLMLSLGMSSICTMLTPLCAATYPLLIAVRVLTGLAEAASFPCIYGVLKEWVPLTETSHMMAVALAGSYIGTFMAFPITATIIEHCGWKPVFYVWGLMGVAWMVLWQWIGGNRPEEHRWVSEAERQYIANNIKKPDEASFASGKVPMPWSKCVRSPSTWALIVAHCTYNWHAYLLITELPSFMQDVLRYDVSKSGLVAGLPFLALFLVQVASSKVADRMIERGYRRVNVRRLFQTSGLLGAGALLVLCSYLDDQALAMAVLLASAGVSGMCVSGYVCGFVEICPDNASYLMALSNTFATVPGILAPTLTGMLLTSHGCHNEGDPGCRSAYQELFWMSAGILVAGSAVYCAFIRAHPLY